jgi:hypothetical protein
MCAELSKKTMSRDDGDDAITVNARSEAAKRRLLEGYTRLDTDACRRVVDVQDLLVLIKKGDRSWLSLQPETIDDVLELADDGTRSLCRIVFLDLFGLSEYQYKQIVREFADPKAESGVWVKDDGQFAIVVRFPDKEAWYNDSKFKKTGAVVGAAAGAAGVGLGYWLRKNDIVHQAAFVPIGLKWKLDRWLEEKSEKKKRDDRQALQATFSSMPADSTRGYTRLGEIETEMQ